MTRALAREVRRRLPSAVAANPPATDASPAPDSTRTRLGCLVIILLVITCGALLSTLGVLVRGSDDSELLASAAVGGGGTALGIVLVVVGAYLGRRSRNDRYASVFRDVRVQLGDDGVTVEGPTLRWFIKWSAFHGWVEMDGFIALYGAGAEVVIPDDALDEGSRSAVRDTLAIRIRPQTPQGTEA
jgi:hypothetical protein